jgi:hypothetical protein
MRKNQLQSEKRIFGMMNLDTPSDRDGTIPIAQRYFASIKKTDRVGQLQSCAVFAKLRIARRGQ